MLCTERGSRIRPHAGDEGLGLVEIIVSLLLLAVLTLSVAPLLIQGLNQSARMSTLAAANQLLAAQMESARSSPPACGANTSVVATTTDTRQVPLAATRVTGACPAARPGTFKVDVTVRRTDTGVTLSTASTLVYVS